MADADLVIIGAGAAGLAAAHFAGEAARGTGTRVLILDGARKPGAKILVSGGGRCNVTNEHVTTDDYFGGPSTIVRRVLRSFDERCTRGWMNDLGVRLKLEPTGKYFPKSDRARTVLDGLLKGVERTGVEMLAGARVEGIEHGDGLFTIRLRSGDSMTSSRVILATGGLSLPKSGSDGWGLEVAGELGHSIRPTTPALSPLVLRRNETVGGRFANFSGLTLDAHLLLLDEKGRTVYSWRDSTLFTHFGLSGPAPLNLSRHVLQARAAHPGAVYRTVLGLAEFEKPDEAEQWLLQEANRNGRRQVSSVLSTILPDRIAQAFAENDGRLAEMNKTRRRELAIALAMLEIDVVSDRGYSFAETTAGGVELREVNAQTMESRIVPGLHFCGEMLDVDGRIGGFNFQWAWATGYLAGLGAMKHLVAGKR